VLGPELTVAAAGMSKPPAPGGFPAPPSGARHCRAEGGPLLWRDPEGFEETAMRAAFILGLAVLLFPIAAGAQSDNSKAKSSGGSITKEQYVERAKQRAAKRFDRLDTNHDGVLTSDERRSGRRKKSSQD